MRSLQINDYGAPLTPTEIAVPAPGPGQLLVQVYYTTLNPIDPKRASGNMRNFFPLEFPWTPGGDVSGVVQQVGPGVTEFKVGDEVFGLNPAGGAYAEQMVIDAAAVARKPEALTHQQAAAVALVGQTAQQSLAAADLKPGQTVLIHGGSGGIGSLAIQLAHQQGLRVITTAQSAHKDLLLRLGADVVVDYTSARFENEVELVDAVLDLVGGDTQGRSYAVLKPGGILVAASQPPDPEECRRHNVRGTMVQTDVKSEGLRNFAEQIVSGKITPLIAEVEPLWNPEKLWAKRPASATPGKVVFTVSNS